MTVKIIVGDALESLKKMDDESVHCCITSPPYFGLRDYGVIGQMGLEATPEEFISSMVEVFREVRRVLRDDGTCWVNMGDSYMSSGQRTTGRNDTNRETPGGRGGSFRGGVRRVIPSSPISLKPKDLMGMPWRLALAMQADGWYLRSDIIWAKPNPMPESVTDRPTKAHEYVFLFSKSARYFYDNEAVREGHKDINRPNGPREKDGIATGESFNQGWNGQGYKSIHRHNKYNPAGRNRRTVWTIATQPYKEAHFATFPTKLVEPMIKAGTSEKGCCPECGAPWVRDITRKANYTKRQDRGQYNKPPMVDSSGWQPATVTDRGWQPSCTCHGHFEEIESDSDYLKPLRVYVPDEDAPDPIPCTVLDPFAGACTTGLVADRLDRDAIMLELNPEYAEMGRKRIADDAGWVSEVETVDDAPRQMGMFDV